MKSLLSILFVALAVSASAAITNAQSRVTLAWDPSPGTNVIGNYRVYYGVASGVYTNSQSAGTAMTLTITNLIRGATYWFAATATSTNGLESDYSSQVSATIPAPPAPPTLLRIIAE